MSELTRPKQSDFVLELMRLNSAQRVAKTPEDREHADHELALFLRYNAEGRLPEYWATRQARSQG